MDTVLYELELNQDQADYLGFVGNPKNPHLSGLKVQVPRKDWLELGSPTTIDVTVGPQYSATQPEEPAPKAKKAKKK